MTSSLNGMNLEELRQILYGRLGLIIGPSVTFSPRIFTDLRDAVAQSFREPIPSSGTYLDVGDALISKGISEDKLREAVNGFFRLQKPSDLSRALVKARWSAILSATLDGSGADSQRGSAIMGYGASEN